MHLFRTALAVVTASAAIAGAAAAPTHAAATLRCGNIDESRSGQIREGGAFGVKRIRSKGPSCATARGVARAWRGSADPNTRTVRRYRCTGTLTAAQIASVRCVRCVRGTRLVRFTYIYGGG